MEATPDRITRDTVIAAPLERVWRAISDASRFGTWFGVEFEGDFVAGARLRGKLVPTTIDPDIGRQQAPYAGMQFDIVVERIEPMHLFSYRWHPSAVEPDGDYSAEPMTLVEFALEAVDGGTRLTVTESGFDQVPPQRRAAAFTSNSEGWAMQLQLVSKYVASPRVD